MMKKQLALLLACLMLFTFAACGGDSPAAPNEGTSQSSDSGQENIETPQGEEEESVPSFSVPTQNDPPAVYEGINMVNLVPEGCTEVVYDGGVYIYKLSSAPTSETLVNFINEKLIPEIQACSDTGTCLVKDPSGNDVLGLERGVTPLRAFDSFGYRVSDSGTEYAYWIIDGEQFDERQLSGGGMKLLDVRYVYDGVLYDAITRVREEDQAISVTPFEESNQKFEIVE